MVVKYPCEPNAEDEMMRIYKTKTGQKTRSEIREKEISIGE